MKINHLIFFLFLIPLAVNAEMYTISEKESQVGFEIIKFKIGAPVQGKFTSFSGQFNYDLKSRKISKIMASIKTTTVNTSNEKRDNHLRTSDFFDVKKFPEMVYKSKGEVKVGQTFSIDGMFTLKGISKAVVLKVKKKEVEKNKIIFEAETEINRLDHNVVWNATLEKSEWKTVLGVLGKTVLDDKVKIMLKITAYKK